MITHPISRSNQQAYGKEEQLELSFIDISAKAPSLNLLTPLWRIRASFLAPGKDLVRISVPPSFISFGHNRSQSLRNIQSGQAKMMGRNRFLSLALLIVLLVSISIPFSSAFLTTSTSCTAPYALVQSSAPTAKCSGRESLLPLLKAAKQNDNNDKEEYDAAVQKAAKAMTAFTNKYLANTCTKLCSDKAVPAVVIQGLAEHKVEFGSPLCPCRFYDDKAAEAKDGYWNCPCVPMRERHECHCMLFLTEDNAFAGDEVEISYEEVIEKTGGMAA